jgi:hypothetical protein
MNGEGGHYSFLPLLAEVRELGWSCGWVRFAPWHELTTSGGVRDGDLAVTLAAAPGYSRATTMQVPRLW